MKKQLILLTCICLLTVPALAADSAHSNDGPAVAAGTRLTPIATEPGDHAGKACDCIQLVFVIDVTGSMGGAIANVAAGLGSILTLADAQSCGNLEGAVVTFRDDVEVLQAMTANQTDITNAINSMVASGGDGWPEASDEGLNELVTAANCLTSGDFLPGDWDPNCCKIAVLVTDAPPAGCDDTYAVGTDDVAASNVANALAAAGVRIAAVQVNSEGFPDAIALPIMINYANVTGGVYGQVPFDGSGTADAIEQAVLDCEGAGATELCCTEAGCFAVLEGQCEAIGGVVVDDCDNCDSVPSETSTWGDLKSLYR